MISQYKVVKLLSEACSPKAVKCIIKQKVIFFCLRKEKQVCAEVAKMYRNNKNKSSIFDIMKKQTKTCASFRCHTSSSKSYNQSNSLGKVEEMNSMFTIMV